MAHTGLHLLFQLHLLGMRKMLQCTRGCRVMMGKSWRWAEILHHALLWDVVLLNEASGPRSIHDWHAHCIGIYTVRHAAAKHGIHQPRHMTVRIVADRRIAMMLPEHLKILEYLVSRQGFECRVRQRALRSRILLSRSFSEGRRRIGKTKRTIPNDLTQGRSRRDFMQRHGEPTSCA